MSTATASDDRIDPALRKLIWVLVLGALAPALDTTIVNVALATLGQALHTSLATSQWTITGYLLASGRLPLPSGRGWSSTIAARTTPIRPSGSPARTTAWPTPSTTPATSPPAPAGEPNASAPNANHHQHEQGAEQMAADNHTTIVGNLVEDPEVRFTNTGIAVTNLRVAVTQRVQQDGQWRDGDTSFFKVNVWRGQAENLAESLGKGDRVMVTGRLRQRSWETPEGEKRSVTELEADEVGASLKWATAKVERSSQRGNGDRNDGRERHAERGDFNDQPPF
jgi:single-strand DNA-binding protein